MQFLIANKTLVTLAYPSAESLRDSAFGVKAFFFLPAYLAFPN
jgi:hypothetical protein